MVVCHTNEERASINIQSNYSFHSASYMRRLEIDFKRAKVVNCKRVVESTKVLELFCHEEIGTCTAVL